MKLMISYHYSSCCCCCCWGDFFRKSPRLYKAPSFQIGSGWNSAWMFFK